MRAALLALLLLVSSSAHAGGTATFLTPGIQTTGTPGAGYTWGLGALASPVDYSARFAVTWDNDDWADGYDTEAELNALGWTTVDITESTSGITCTHGGSGSSEDESGLATVFSSNCTAPSGNTPGVCGNVFKIAADCTIDTTSATGSAEGGAPGVSVNYSDFALIGEDPETSIIYANNTAAANTDMMGPLFSTGASWGYAGGSDGSTYTRSGGSITQGTTTITLSSCSGLASGDLVQVNATDADGNDASYWTEVTMSGCVATLADPLPTTFSTLTGVTEKGGVGPRNQIFLNFTSGFPYLPDGVGSNASDQTVAPWYYGRATRRMLVQNVTSGAHGNGFIRTRYPYQIVIRHNSIGPGLFTMRKGTNSQGAFGSNNGGSMLSFYDNLLLGGAVRIWPNDGAYAFAYIGFNYQINQTPTNPLEGGNWCGGITNPQGFPENRFGIERSIFMTHDGADRGVVTHALFEANDLACEIAREANSVLGRYVTFYRNRVVRHYPTVTMPTGSTENYMNWIANRSGTFNWNSGSAHMPGTLGLFNVANTTMGTPNGTGTTFPTSSTGKNYVDASEHDDIASTTLPPSLAIRTNDAPSWWCTQSGTWDGAWTFAYGDGYGGTTYKLPAQIRYEGTTCTPP